MTEAKAGRTIVELLNCRGRLWAGGDAAEATFDVFVDRCGRPTFRMTPRPLDETNVWLMGAGESSGRHVAPLSLEGVAPDGRRVFSEHLYITKWGSETSAGATTVSVDGAPSHLLIRPEAAVSESATAAGAAVKYFVPGILGFRQQAVASLSGRLTLEAQTRLGKAGEISGALVIEADEDETRPLDEWLESCERDCRRVLEILSLVEGRFFRACARDIWCGESWVRTDIWEAPGPGSEAEPVWYSLNLDPFIQLAVRAYTDELRESRGLDVAIEWFFAHSTYVEVKLATAQATLEHLVRCFEEARGLSGSALPRSVFREKVRPQLENAIDAVVADLAGVVDAPALRTAEGLLRGKLGGLNALTIRERLIRMLAAESVPYDGLAEAINDAFGARSSVLHGSKGNSNTSGEYVRHVAVLRELVKRIILTLLGFRGRYISYLNGVDDVDFPPAGPTVVKE